MAMLAANSTLSDQEVAASMGLSEAEVVAAQVGHYVTRLVPDWAGIFRMLPKLGEIRAVTSSGGAEIDAAGEFPTCQEGREILAYRRAAIDLRVAIGHWRSAFLLAVPDAATGKRKRSIEFFGLDGRAIHKVFLTSASSVDAFEEIAERFVNASQSQQVTVMESVGRKGDELSGGRGRRVKPQAIGSFLERLHRAGTGVFGILGNRGCAQAYRGAVEMFWERDGWLRISEARRKLRLRVADVAEAWVVEKPRQAGTLRSLELFDAQGGVAATLLPFGEERTWRQALDSMATWVIP